MSIDTFHEEVTVLINGLRSSRAPTGRADALLAILGGNPTLLRSLKADFDLKETFPRTAPENRDMTSVALVAISEAYFDTRQGLSKELQVLIYALSIDDSWRCCLSTKHSVDALAYVLMTVAFGALAGAESTQCALDILTKWLAPTSGAFIRRESFVINLLDDANKLLQGEVSTYLFGEHWWMFNEPDGSSLLDLEKISPWPELLPGLLPAARKDQVLDLPDLD